MRQFAGGGYRRPPSPVVAVRTDTEPGLAHQPVDTHRHRRGGGIWRVLLKLSPPVPVASPLKLSCMTRVAVALLSGPRGSGVECSLPHGWMPPSDVPLTELLSGGQRPGSGVTEGEQWERVSLVPARAAPWTHLAGKGGPPGRGQAGLCGHGERAGEGRGTGLTRAREVTMNEKDKLSVSYACLRSLADTAASGTGAPGGGRCPRRQAGPWGAGRAPGCRREPDTQAAEPSSS